MNLVLAKLQFLTHLLFSAINLRSIFLFLLELKGKGVVDCFHCCKKAETCTSPRERPLAKLKMLLFPTFLVSFTLDRNQNYYFIVPS